MAVGKVRKKIRERERERERKKRNFLYFVSTLQPSKVHLPANTASIARQFIRCTLHQLSSNGIFRQIFQSYTSDAILFRSIAISLADFAELNQVTPLKELFEVFNFAIISIYIIINLKS